MLTQWMYDQIDEELSAFRGRGVSVRMLDEVAEAYSSNYAPYFARVIVRSGALTYQARTDLFPEYISERFSVMENAIGKIASSLPDLQFELYLEDGFSGWSKPHDAPVFSFSKHRNHDGSIILLPDPHSLDQGPALRKQVAAGAEAYNWTMKIERCFWRGDTTGAPSPKTIENYTENMRLKLVELGKRFPDKIDAAFSRFHRCDQAVKDALIARGFVEPFAPIKEHLRFKYLLVPDGNRSPWQRFFWGLHGNSVLFKQDSDLVGWFDRGVSKDIHFVSTARDFSDLPAKVQAARESDAAMQKVARNGQTFAYENLTDTMMSNYMKILLTQYGHLMAST